MKNALLVRLDKIGDLILTLPADQQKSLAGYECTWIVAPGMGFIPAHAEPPRRYFELSKEWTAANWRKLQVILNDLQPEVTVAFQTPWWISLAFFLFGVKKRVGVLSKWHSFLFLNHGVRQKRSEAKFNELEYNHQLVQQGLRDSSPVEYPFLTLKEFSATVLPALPPKYVVVHPGMAGSARNWSTGKYITLIKMLTPKTAIVITGTSADRPYVNPLREALENEPNILWLNEKLNIEQLFCVLAKAKHVIAPSTGVLHLAASLGTPVTGIYSPVRVQKDTRWGPRGKFTHTLTPKVDCPGHFSCLREKCPHFDCMELVSAQEIYQTIGQI